MTKVFLFFKSISTFFLLALLSGVLIGTSYIPFKGWALLFCYIPIWWATVEMSHHKASYKKIFFYGWITQFVLTLIGFNWIYYVASEFGPLHWTLSAATLLLFATFVHIYIPISLVISAYFIKKLNISKIFIQFLILALNLSLLERVWPSLFEWNLAYTLLWAQFPVYQWADTVGFWGLSTWILIAQALLAYAIKVYKTNKFNSMITVLCLLIGICFLSISGVYKAKAWSKTDAVINVAVAQGNIGNADKIHSEKKSEFHSYIFGIYEELTARHLKNNPSDIMIWPETAMPFGLDQHFHNRTQQQKLIQLTKQWQTPIITGGYSISADKYDHLGYPLTRNAVFYFSPEGGFSDIPYFKTHLLAFGEYMPFGEKLPFLYKLLPFVGTYETGSGPIVAHVKLKNNNVQLGPQICYDSLSPDFSRGLAKNGAEVIFNVTNDSWFGWWAEPYQHNIMTLARGIEVRRPFVRSTNTGFTTAILADGTFLETSPISEKWAHTYNINYIQKPSLTFYTQFGHYDWVLWLLVLLFTIFYYKNKGNHV